MRLFLVGLFGILFILSSLCSQAMAQENNGDSKDTLRNEAPVIRKTNKHSPKKAALMSTFVPGLGQAYNRRYWKLPILYGGSAFFLYNIMSYRKNYIEFRDILADSLNPAENVKVTNIGGRAISEFTIDDLKLERDSYQRYYQLNIIFLGGLYALNILDAYVDAHLKTFEVSESLSLKIDPSFNLGPHNKLYSQLTLNFTLKK